MRAATIIAAIFTLLSAVLVAALPPTGTQVQRITGPYAARAVTAPAASASPSAVRRNVSKRNVAEQNSLVVPDLSVLLCPSGTHACPLDDSPMPVTLLDWMYECVDFSSDLTSCGGCSALDHRCGIFSRGSMLLQYADHLEISRDCTAIPNALAVSCVRGGCEVQSCEPGHVPSSDGQTCISTEIQF
jgi:hypothetical protein